MNNRLVLNLVLLLLAIGVCFAAPIHWVETDGSRVTGQAYPFPVSIVPGYAWLTMATPTYTLGSSTATAMPTLPTSTRRFRFGALGGALNYGGSAVSSGANEIYLASGSFTDWIYTATTTYGLYHIGRQGATPQIIVHPE